MPEFLLQRRRLLLAAAGSLALILLAGRFALGAGTTTVAPLPSPPVENAGVTGLPAARVVVHVVGAVRRPGLYRLEQGSRIADAVARAGGATGKADLAQVNLAAPLTDGEQVVVPKRGAAGAVVTGAGSGGAGAVTGPVHLSTATLEQLDSLPGIGPVTAQKILDYRAKHGAFSSVDELDAVPGIGPSRMDQLRDLVAP
ncbi:MAG TPA: helix-hairpin-helix domain-containing protein [Gaiellaceae bacterium]|nr:helix-hairpin-helix domain-containing protein [Gaiellaceae bacterium]